MVVYLDTLIFENFIIDFFLLYVTLQLMKIKVKIWSNGLASLAGSLYAAAYLLNTKIFGFILFKLFFSFIMIFITLRGGKLKRIIYGTVILISLSMLLAGFCIFTVPAENLYFYWNGISYKNILIGIMLTYILLWQIIYYIGEKKRINNLLYNVEIVSKYGSKVIKCFLDTGNNLREPVTKIPVIIIYSSCLKEFNIEQSDLVKIPYFTVGGFNSVINAFMPDYIKIYDKNQTCKQKAFIGLSDTEISKNEEYDGLLPRGYIINGGLI
ncbi:MAG: sigma-E processing peptidase SpoIIGA [Bacillota bacterium]|nr:sigma-E processing peptidase SpoIIGA [Bacillota bacterium]